MLRLQNISVYFLYFVFALSLIQHSSCTSVDPTVQRALDSLDAQLIETEQLLAIDYSTIENRKDLISFQLRIAKRFYTEEMSPEVGMNFAKYKGVLKVYSKFVEGYGFVLEEHKALVKQARDLRASMENFELQRSKFKEYYESEKAAAIKNHEKVERVCSAVPKVEPEYQRLSKKITLELYRLAEGNTDLSEALESYYSDN